MMDSVTVKSHGKFVRVLALCKKVIDRYNEQNTSLRTARVDYPRPKVDEATLEHIVLVQKVRKPSIYST